MQLSQKLQAVKDPKAMNNEIHDDALTLPSPNFVNEPEK